MNTARFGLDIHLHRHRQIGGKVLIAGEAEAASAVTRHLRLVPAEPLRGQLDHGTGPRILHVA